MKLKLQLLPATAMLLLAFNVHAQQKHLLTSLNDPLLLQLVNNKKTVQFNIEQTSKGPVVSFYEIKQTAAASATKQPVNGNTAAAAAKNFHLVKDINVQTDANPINSDHFHNNPFAILNNIMYFAADDGIHGSELWRSDGTAAGTYLVKDLEPGFGSSHPYEIIMASGKLFFETQDFRSNIQKLWVSNGTDAGTVKLLDFSVSGPGVNGSYYLTNVSGTVYFLNRPNNNPQVWKTNGTVAGTVLVKDLTGLGESPALAATANGLYFFTLYNSGSGRELWRSDGTDAGTYMVKDISDTTDYFYGPANLTNFNNKLYFSADDGTGRKIWFTDGTTAGTQPAYTNNNVKVYYSFSYSFVNTSFTVRDNDLFFGGSKPATGNELFKYNVANGPSLVKDITPGSAGGFLLEVTNTDNYVAFVYQDTVAKKIQLWSTTGIPSSTKLIREADNYSEYYFNLKYSNGLLYFQSNAGGNGYELWKTDGTTAGTIPVKDIYKGSTSSYPSGFTPFKNELYFSANSKNSGTELWHTDGTITATALVKEINNSATSESGPNFYSGIAFGLSAGSAIDNTLYFSASKPETGYELYKSDGSAASTSLVKDIYQGELGSFPSLFSSKNNNVYFFALATDTNNGNIFKADSNGNIKGLHTKTGSFINAYSVADNGVVFYIIYGESGLELWRTDGTAAGNYMLKDSLVQYYPNTVKTVNNKAFFVVSSAAKGNELWTSDGTVAGTKLVKDINKGSAHSTPYSLYPFNNEIYFGANNGSGVALWKSDGTAAGTKKIKDIYPYNSNATGQDYNNFFCVLNGYLYLNASDNQGTGLWKTDGTSAGTVPVKDVNGITLSNPAYLTNVNNTLFLYANQAQLWKSNGTAAGTLLVKEIGNIFTERAAAANKFFFNKDGYLWVSDGTSEGTHAVADKGLDSVSLVSNLAVAGNTLFFNGFTNKYSYELYAGDASQVITSIAESGTNNKLPATFNVSVLQNPVTSLLNLAVKSYKDQVLTIIISNRQGNAIATKRVNVNKGSNMLRMNAAAWPGGLYIVNAKGNAGDEISISVLK